MLPALVADVFPGANVPFVLAEGVEDSWVLVGVEAHGFLRDSGEVD